MTGALSQNRVLARARRKSMDGMNALEPLPPVEPIAAWRCIGCGRLEAFANCVGVCEDRKVELVGAWDYAEAATRFDTALGRIAALEGLVGKLAKTTPREGSWKASYLAFQREAQRLMAPHAG